MCPQGHPHQLEPILLKHFPMVLKAKAERKTRGKLALNQVVPVCVERSFLGAYFFLHCTTYIRTHDSYILQHHRNYSTDPPPAHPSPFNKINGKGWTNKIILQQPGTM